MISGAPAARSPLLTRRGALSLVTTLILGVIVLVQLLVRSAISRDEMENIHWGQALSWGNEKHPPLFGWVNYLWVEVFGRADLSTFVLEKLNVALGLFLAYLIARRILGPGKALLATALSLATVNVVLMALKYNGNSALWPVWLAFLLLLHIAVRGGQWWAWIGVGLLGAAAVLTKYHSLVLLACTFGWLISSPRGRSILTGPAPWIGVLCGLALLAPHIYWLFTDGVSALAYASDNLTQGAGLAAHARYPVKYVLVQAVFLCPALVLLWRWARRDRLETRSPPDELDQQFLLWHGPVLGLVPAGLSLVSGMSLGSMWGIATWGLFPAWAVARFGLRPRRARVRRALLAALALAGVYVAAAVVDGVFVARQLPYKPASAAVLDAWAERYDTPLTIVGGDGRYYEGLAVYAPGEPDVFGALDPATHRRVSHERIQREGGVLLIPADMTESLALARERFDVDTEAQLTLPAEGHRLYRTRAEELLVLFLAPEGGNPPNTGR